jgi:hypothetical protein
MVDALSSPIDHEPPSLDLDTITALGYADWPAYMPAIAAVVVQSFHSSS